MHQEGRLSDEYWDTRKAIFSAYMHNEPALALYKRDKALGILQTTFTLWADGLIEGREE